jgi:hypothetical protein
MIKREKGFKFDNKEIKNSLHSKEQKDKRQNITRGLEKDSLKLVNNSH